MELQLNMAGGSEYPSYLRTLIVGQPGVGKTEWASSMPNPLFANAAGGLTTLSRKGQVPYVEINSLADLFGVKVALDRTAKERKELFGFPVDTLILDTVDELQRRVLNERLRNEHRSETKIEDWGWLADRFHSIFEGLTQLDVHTVFIAHTKEVQLSNGEVVYKPALAGQFCEHIHTYVDASILMRAATPPVEVNAVTVDTDDGETHITPVSTQRVDRWFVTTPQVEAEWVNDKTGLFPSYCDPTDLLQLFLDKDIDLVKSSNRILEIDPPGALAPEEPKEIPGQLSIDDELDEPSVTFSCESCGKPFNEKTWHDLSRMKYNATYCGECFKNQNTKGKVNGTNSNVKLSA